LYTIVFCECVYLVAGLWFAIVFFPRSRYSFLAIPVFLVIGLFSGFVMGSPAGSNSLSSSSSSLNFSCSFLIFFVLLPGGVLAAMYYAGNLIMTSKLTAVWAMLFTLMIFLTSLTRSSWVL